MNKIAWSLLTVVAVALVGCGNSNNSNPSGQPDAFVGDPDAADQTPDPPSAPQPVAIESGVATLNAENTKIDFLGTKKDGSHSGGFRELSGKIEVDAEAKSLKSVSVEIQSESIWSDTEKLTDHLKKADFFNAPEYPTLKFASTKVETTDAATGSFTVTGDLTMLETTKEISFPVMATISDEGLLLSSEFKIDRTEFGMTYGEGQIDHEVTITVAVGSPAGAEGGRGRGRGGFGGGGRQFDPAARFAEWDADQDGKLTGDEIPEFMRGRLDAFDQDGDGSVTLEEMQERMRRFREGGGRGPRGNGADRPQRPNA